MERKWQAKMNILSLDCEYNQPTQKTIQIGAAVYAARTGQLMEKFETYVNPGELIEPYITELTGITDRDVKNAPSIQEAFLALQDLHKKHKCFKNPLVWGSGTRNDSQMIYNEAAIKDTEDKLIPNFMGYRVLDVKSLFQSIQIYNNKTVRGGLKTTCETIGIGFEGQAHTALADAMNTFRVWHFLIKQFPQGYK